MDNSSRLVSCILVAFFICLVGCNVFGQAKPITLDLLPNILFCTPQERVALRVLIRIDPNKDNRYLHLTWTAPKGESGSSLIQMEAETAPLSYVRIVTLNCDFYLIRACLLRTQGKRLCASRELYPP